MMTGLFLGLKLTVVLLYTSSLLVYLEQRKKFERLFQDRLRVKSAYHAEKTFSLADLVAVKSVLSGKDSQMKAPI